MTGSDATTGMQLARMGRFAEALPWLERANRTAPLDIPVLHALANLLVLVGRGPEADERYRVAASLLPNDLGLLRGWGRVSLMIGLRDQAFILFERALVIEPDCGNPGGWLEATLLEAADLDTACELLGDLADKHPQHVGLRGIHARTLLANERLEEAQTAFERYHSLRPQDVWASVNLGDLATRRGDQETARAHFRGVLKSDPGNADALWSLAEMNDWRLDARLHDAVKRAIAAKPSIRVLARLHETLGKHYDRSGEFAAAWRHAGRANALSIEATAPAQRYDAGQHEARIDFLVHHYTAPLFDRLRGCGNPDRRPVFVIGLPRSGTTLLERMLAAHPDIVGAGEQHLAEASWKRALAACGGSQEALAAPAIDEASAWHLRMLEQRAHHLGLSANVGRIVDKLPDNYLMAGWLGLAFPNAAIVHVRRDPRDVAISCWFAQFGNAQWINELRHIAHRIEQHRRLMRNWRDTLDHRLIEVRYEDLIADPEMELRRVLAALRMDWHPDVVAFADRGGYVGTASRQQVREPVHARSLGRWHNYAGALEPILGRLDLIAAEDAVDFAPTRREENDAVVAGTEN
jgi:tetratricopeptide (TPR) repeat protein